MSTEPVVDIIFNLPDPVWVILDEVADIIISPADDIPDVNVEELHLELVREGLDVVVVVLVDEDALDRIRFGRVPAEFFRRDHVEELEQVELDGLPEDVIHHQLLGGAVGHAGEAREWRARGNHRPLRGARVQQRLPAVGREERGSSRDS